MRFWRVFPFVACLILAFFPSSVSAGSVQVTEESEWSFTVVELGTVYIYGNSNQSCSEVTVDPYLWLYDSAGVLIAQDDDSNHGESQCVSSKIVTELEPGDYTVLAGYCCRQLGLGNTPTWGDGVYELLILDYEVADTTTTSSTSTSTTVVETTTTTSEPTTTTTEPPTTTTSTTTEPATTTTSTTTTTTTVAPTTTPPPPPPPAPRPPRTEVTTTWVPTTTSTIPPTTSTSIAPTTTVPATTLAPTTTETSAPPTTQLPTTPPPATTSVAQPPSATAPNVFETAPPVTTSPTTTTELSIPTTDTPTTTTIAPSVIPQPEPDAPTELKIQFENEVNVFDGTHDDYVPSGSTISVAERRTIVAVTVAVSSIMPTAPSRRRK